MATTEPVDLKDKELEKEIERRLPKSGLRFPIQVVTKGGYVRLFGYVDTLGIKNEIETILQSVPGVKVVTNHLKPWEEKRSPAHL